MSFVQDAPWIENTFTSDRPLQEHLRRLLPAPMLESVQAELVELGRESADLLKQSWAERDTLPVHTPFDAWGNRIDHIELTPLWKNAASVAARYGLVARAYAAGADATSRIAQFALVHVFGPSSDLYTCPLAMTDGAAQILSSEEHPLLRDAFRHLTTQNPAELWTSGQWMTEQRGGSDVSQTETVARKDGDTFRLYGKKWFTSATTSEVALTLARLEGNPEGSQGLGLYFVSTREPATGKIHPSIEVLRLKDKLGTRKVPTAELMLHGVPAINIGGTTGGVRNIAPMLNITRTWNAVSACAFMSRTLMLARDFANKRTAFGGLLAAKPAHLRTLAELSAEYEGALALTMELVRLLGAVERAAVERTPSDDEALLLRVLTPIVKLTTAKQAVRVTAEAMECLGGTGYVEDAGMATWVRDAHVLPIWEGTTNVLALDAAKVVRKDGADVLIAFAERLLANIREPTMQRVSAEAARRIRVHCDRLRKDNWEQNARDAALGIGHALELLLLAVHAHHVHKHSEDTRARRAAALLARMLPPTVDVAEIESITDMALS